MLMALDDTCLIIPFGVSTWCSFLMIPTLYGAAAAKLLQSCPTLCNPIDGSPPGSLSLGFSRQEHWMGCHFLLQCMKVKSESEVAQSCPTLSDPMDCSLLGSSVHGIFQARVLEWGAIAFSLFGATSFKFSAIKDLLLCLSMCHPPLPNSFSTLID